MDVGAALGFQAWACRQMGSPLYAALLDRAGADYLDGGAVFSLLDGFESSDPAGEAVALRMMAGVHRLVLEGRAPDLAAHYPSTGGDPRFPECGDVFLATVASNFDELREALHHPVQTNEVTRSALFLGGLIEVTRLTGLPLRLREIGSSAGLNLLVDRYRYQLGAGSWGPRDSPVVVRSHWEGHPPDLTVAVTVTDRRGSDPNPLDVTDDGAVLLLRSYVWADQTGRLALLSAAVELARRAPPQVEKASGADFLDRHLHPHEGVATAAMHSVVMQYVPAAERHHILRTIRDAGSRATRDAPVAWLRFEPAQGPFELRLSLWPHDVDLVLATAHPHGGRAQWFVGSEPK